jgi:hypothetical protein
VEQDGSTSSEKFSTCGRGLAGRGAAPAMIAGGGRRRGCASAPAARSSGGFTGGDQMRGRRCGFGSAATAAALALLLAALPGAAQEPAPAPAAGPLEVRWQDGRLAAEVGEVPVAAVLEAVAQATGADVKATGELGTTSRQSFQGLPLEAALRRLVGDHGVVVRYGPPAAGETAPRVVAIRVYAAVPGAREAQLAAKPRNETQRRQPAAAAPATARAGEAMAERAKTIAGLADRGDDEAAAELQRMLAAETDPGLRRQMVAALVSVGSPRSAEGLALALRDPLPEIRIQAARGLWDLEGAAAIDRLEAALAAEQDERVRRLLEQLVLRAQPQGAQPPGPRSG